jgi:WXG100 family type VII secretion target
MSSAQVMGQGQGALSTSAGLVDEARQDLDRLNSELVSHIDAARSRWTGQGGSAFSALGHAWSEKQRAIVRALDGFEVALRSTERDNVTTDETQAAGFGRTQQRLG